MAVVGVIGVVLSFLLLGAHVMRFAGLRVALFVAALSLLLLIRSRWAARLIQVLLLIGALEWLRTIVAIASQRMDEGRPWARMAIILSAVFVLTLLSAAAFRIRALAARYGLTNPAREAV